VPTRPILVVEDNDDARETLLTLLAAEGYAVVGARDGNEALAYLRSGPASLIILDLTMDGMSGPAFLAARETNPTVARIPVVVWSAFMPEDLPNVAEYVVKGGRPQQLLKVVARFCLQDGAH